MVVFPLKMVIFPLKIVIFLVFPVEPPKFPRSPRSLRQGTPTTFASQPRTSGAASRTSGTTPTATRGRLDVGGVLGRCLPSKLTWLPSGKLTKNYGKSPCLMGKSTISMAIFNSYFSLPEAIPYANHGAGIFTYMTGWFILGKCWDSYSSTMEHLAMGNHHVS